MKVVLRASRTSLPLVWIAVVALGGCVEAHGPVRKAVAREQAAEAIGTRPPETSYRAPDGRARRLRALFGEATVVAFVEQACPDGGDLLGPAARTWGERGVAFIELCSEPDGCPTHGDCTLVQHDDGSDHLSLLCDAGGIVRRRWAVAAGTIFVLDRRGVIVATDTIEVPSGLDDLVQRAVEMADGR